MDRSHICNINCRGKGAVKRICIPRSYIFCTFSFVMAFILKAFAEIEFLKASPYVSHIQKITQTNSRQIDI